MKKIIICTANYYTSKYQVGSHNYARAFEKLGYEVAFLSVPISPLHFLFSKGDSLSERNHIYKKNGVKVGNIWHYVPKVYLAPQNKPILSSKYIFKNWYKFSKINILNLLKKNNFDNVDILWIESPLYQFMLNSINYKKSIFRIADYSKGFNSSWQLFYDIEVEIANSVDRIVYTGEKLYQLYSGDIIDTSKMLYLPNGIDLDLVKISNKGFPDEFTNIPKPRVVYIGMIDTWFDVDLLYNCAITLSSLSFILIGDSAIDLSKLKKLKNVYVLGSKPHSEISKYLSHSDIGIIPFKRNNFVDAINPIKLYEYAAFGLKVVTTKWKEIEKLSSCFSVCEDSNEFLNELLDSKKKNINKWLIRQDWKEKARKAIEFETTI